MKLAIPTIIDGIFYKNVEIMRPNAEVITSTVEYMQNGNYFNGLYNFVSKSIISIDDVIDKEKIRRLCQLFKMKSIEDISIDIMLKRDKTNGMIEGVYSCPRCGVKKISELKNGIDTRDSIFEQPIIDFDLSDDYFAITLDYPIEIDINKNITTINEIGLRFPEIKDYIEAEAIHGYKKASDIQNTVYKKCIKRINGAEATKDFVATLGDLLFKKIDPDDSKKIAQKIRSYGRQLTKLKSCNECGKEFDVELNTNDFFVCALL